MADQEARMAEENREFALNVITRIEANTGLEIRGFFEQDLTPNEIRQRMHAAVVEYVNARQATEQPSEEWPLAGQTIDAHEALFGRGRTNLTPNVAVTEYNYNVLKGYRGGQVHDYVKKVTNGLALLNDGMSAGEAAATIIGSGIVAFALPMIFTTAKELIAKKTLRAAVTLGVKAMGKMSVVVGVAVLIVTELLLYLIFKNEKVFLGMIFNNTPLNLVVHDWRNGTGGGDNSDLFMNTGSMNTFMETNLDEKLDSPLIQILEKLDVDDPAENIVSGGIFCAEKNAGLFGTEGAMVLSSYTKDGKKTLPRFGLVFACPYSYDNGVNVQVDATNMISAKDYFNKLYTSRGQYKTTNAGGYTFAASCSAPRGGEAAGIATLDANG